MQAEKRCSKCGEIKPLEKFWKDRNRKDGRYIHCADCENAKRNGRRRQRDTFKERQRKRQEKKALATKGLKACTRCEEVKAFDCFDKNGQKKDGLSCWCKSCKSVTAKDRIDKDRAGYNARQRELERKRDPAKKRAYKKAYDERNRERNRLYRESRREHKKKIDRAYYLKNRDKWRKYEAEKIATDRQYKLRSYLRRRLVCSIRQQFKTGSAVRDLGCSIEQLERHLESQFHADENGVMMNWDNWGKVWNIDHIYPLSMADLEDRAVFLAVNNWQNLQPLIVRENNRKNNKITPEALALFRRLHDQFTPVPSNELVIYN